MNKILDITVKFYVDLSKYFSFDGYFCYISYVLHSKCCQYIFMLKCRIDKRSYRRECFVFSTKYEGLFYFMNWMYFSTASFTFALLVTFLLGKDTFSTFFHCLFFSF